MLQRQRSVINKSTHKVSFVRKKKKSSVLVMDGIAYYFLGRLLFPFLKTVLAGNYLSFFLLPVWLFLAHRSDNNRQLWKSLTSSKSFVIGLCGYSVWLVGEFIVGRSPDAETAVRWLIFVALPVYIMSCFYGYLHPERFWKIVRVMLAFLGVQAAYSLPYLIAGTWNPKFDVMHAQETLGYARGHMLILNAALHGIGGYALYMRTAVIVSVIAGFAIYRRRGWFARSFWILAWAFLVLACIESTFTASTVVALFGTMAVLACAVVARKLALSTVVILVVITGLLGGLAINNVRSSEEYEYTFTKLSNIFESVDKGGLRSEPTGRGERLFMSWNAFVESPIVGHGAEGAHTAAADKFYSGGHSTWLNILVAYGLVGSIWYFVMVFSVGREIWRAVRMRSGDLLAMSFMAAYLSYLIYGFIDTVMMDVAFFFFLYGGAMALQGQSTVDQRQVRSSPVRRNPARSFPPSGRMRPYPTPWGGYR